MTRRINIHEARHRVEPAHNGIGTVETSRLSAAMDTASAIDHVDHTTLQPGTSIGVHTHGGDEEEYYLVLRGAGHMTLDEQVLRVASGDLIRNRPGGTHGLENTGAGPLEIFVFQVRA